MRGKESIRENVVASGSHITDEIKRRIHQAAGSELLLGEIAEQLVILSLFLSLRRYASLLKTSLQKMFYLLI